MHQLDIILVHEAQNHSSAVAPQNAQCCCGVKDWQHSHQTAVYLNHLHVDLDVGHENGVLVNRIRRNVRKHFRRRPGNHADRLWLDAGQRVGFASACLAIRHDGAVVPVQNVLNHRLNCCLVHISLERVLCKNLCQAQPICVSCHEPRVWMFSFVVMPSSVMDPAKDATASE